MTQDVRAKDQVQAEVLEIVLAVLREVKDGEGNKLAKVSPQTLLYGLGSDVDSLALIELLVGVEKGIRDRYGFALAVTDEELTSREESPFRTATALAEYLAKRVGEQRSASGPG
jgi:acyl carrier protein